MQYDAIELSDNVHVCLISTSKPQYKKNPMQQNYLTARPTCVANKVDALAKAP
jgi:hypothetical protein